MHVCNNSNRYTQHPIKIIPHISVTKGIWCDTHVSIKHVPLTAIIDEAPSVRPTGLRVKVDDTRNITTMPAKIRAECPPCTSACNNMLANWKTYCVKTYRVNDNRSRDDLVVRRATSERTHKNIELVISTTAERAGFFQRRQHDFDKEPKGERMTLNQTNTVTSTKTSRNTSTKKEHMVLLLS